MREVRKVFLAAVAFLTLSSAVACYPVLKKEAQHPEEALRQVRFFSHTFRDDMDRDSLTLAIRRNLEYLDRLNRGQYFTTAPTILPASRCVRATKPSWISCQKGLMKVN
jgi:hypothetical protein